MLKAKVKKQYTLKKAAQIVGLIIIVLILLSGLTLLIFNLLYQDKFLPRTKIDGISVANLTTNEARQKLYERLDKLNEGINFKAENHDKTAKPEELGINIDLEQTLMEASIEESSEFIINKSFKQISQALFGHNQNLIYSIDKEKLEEFIQAELEPLGKSFVNLTLEPSDSTFEIIQGEEGQSLNTRLFVALLNERISSLNPESITVPFSKTYSQIEEDELQIAKAEAWQVGQDSLVLEFEGETWEITPKMAREWLTFSIRDLEEEPLEWGDYSKKENFDLDNFILAYLSGNVATGKNYEKILRADFDRKKIEDFLAKIAQEVNIRPQNARFQMQDGVLVLLEESTPGRELLINKNYEKIIAEGKKLGKKKIILETQVTGAEITADNIDKLGIKEIIGSGTSNFAGSPQNRIHNINIAASKLNGILVKPGKEFSLVEAIGEVNAATGYLPELVIKERKTIPEYGGGLCQIATTAFRAAMDSGVDITERESHAYAVQYYAPQGTDATIYIPHPDLRFYNDTPGHILIQTFVSGSTLTFEFYGTNDSRSVELIGPDTWDHKSDGSLKAKWTQKVTYPDGHVREDVFYSNYRPPQEFHEDEEKEEEKKEEEKKEEPKEEPKEDPKEEPEEDEPDENVNSDDNVNTPPPDDNSNENDNNNNNSQENENTNGNENSTA